MKQIQNELGTQILADFEEALSVKGIKVHSSASHSRWTISILLPRLVLNACMTITHDVLKRPGHAILCNFCTDDHNNGLEIYKHLKETQISQKEAWMGKIRED